MASSRILVVTPTLGRRSSLKRTILSVACIGGDRVHHVLSGPPSQLLQYSKQFPWIDIFDDSGSSGVYGSINAVLKSDKFSSYEFFAYLNDDDYWLPGFSRLLNVIHEKRSVDVVYARTVFVRPGDSGRLRLGPFTPALLDAASLFSVGIPAFTQQSLILRLQLLHDHGLFDLSRPISADSILWQRILEASPRVVSLNVFASVYDLRGERLSNNPALRQSEVPVSNSSLSPSRKNLVCI